MSCDGYGDERYVTAEAWNVDYNTTAIYIYGTETCRVRSSCILRLKRLVTFDQPLYLCSWQSAIADGHGNNNKSKRHFIDAVN